jgi:drug/metabolite transporter (DMT)-like permease
MKYGLAVFSPIQVAGTRLVVAGAILLPWVIKYSFIKPLKKQPSNLNFTDYFWLFVSGVLGNAIPAFLFSTAGRLIPSGLSGILNAFTPMFTLLFAFWVFREKLDKAGVIGVILGLAGAIFLFAPSLLNYGEPISLLGSLMPLAAAMLYGLNINIIKHKLGHLPAMVKTAYPFVFVGILYACLLWYTDFFLAWDQHPGELKLFESRGNISANTAFFYLFLLGFMGSAVSMILFNYIIKYVSPLVASTNTFIIPVTAVMWGFADHEQLTWNVFVGMLFLLAAVFIIIRKPKI